MNKLKKMFRNDKEALKEIEKLIYSSCLDHFSLTKKAMIESYPTLLSREKYIHIKSLKPVEYELSVVWSSSIASSMHLKCSYSKTAKLSAAPSLIGLHGG